MPYSNLLKNRDFVFLWVSQILSQISYNLVSFALIISVYNLTKSNLSVGLLLLTCFLPSFIFSLPAGIYADMADRKRTMITTRFLWALIVLGFTVPFVRHHFPLVLLVVVLAQLVDEFFTPAERALLPNLVAGEDLLMANSLFTFSFYSAMILGFGMSGVLIRFLGERSPFLIAAILTFVSSVIIGFVRREQGFFGKSANLFRGKTGGAWVRALASRVEREVREGIVSISGRKDILAIILGLAAFRGVSDSFISILPGYMERSLGIRSYDVSIIFAIPLGVGFLIGVGLLGHFGQKLTRQRLVRLGLGLCGGALLGMSMVPSLKVLLRLNGSGPTLGFFENLPHVSGLVMFLAALLGIGASLIFITASTIFQESTPDRFRGRAQALLNTMSYALGIIPVIFTGAMADFLGAVFIFFALGLGSLYLYFKIDAWVEKVGLVS